MMRDDYIPMGELIRAGETRQHRYGRKKTYREEEPAEYAEPPETEAPARQVRAWDEETKKEVLDCVFEKGETLNAVCERYQVPVGTAYYWFHQARNAGRQVPGGQKKPRKKKGRKPMNKTMATVPAPEMTKADAEAALAAVDTTRAMSITIELLRQQCKDMEADIDAGVEYLGKAMTLLSQYGLTEDWEEGARRMADKADAYKAGARALALAAEE